MRIKKLTILLLILGFYKIGISQNNPINSYYSRFSESINFQDCVKSIEVRRYILFNSISRKRIDTISDFYKVFYSKNQKLKQRLGFHKSFSEDPLQIMEYDSLRRITLLERKRNDTTTLVIKQFFNNESIYPDSTNFYNKVLKKTKQYINYFNDTTVIKQELYTNDILRTYKTFDYDTNNKLIKVIDINTKNGFGVTLGSSITGGKPKKYLNENDTTEYKYSKSGDTLIISEYRDRVLKKIKKEFISNKFSLIITERYGFGYLGYSTYQYKLKDTIIKIERSYSKDRKIKSFQESISTRKNIISKTNYNLTNDTPSETTTTIIKTEFDEYGNWIKKKYIKDDSVEKWFLRKFEYYCH